jgi:hypothetical protein
MGRKVALVIGNSEYDDAGLARLITPSEDEPPRCAHRIADQPAW